MNLEETQILLHMDELSLQVRARIRLHNRLKEAKELQKAATQAQVRLACLLHKANICLQLDNNETSYVPGQSGCFCRECLVSRKHEWRIGDLNSTVVGPRDQCLMFAWGDGERGALCSGSPDTHIQPSEIPPILETITIQDANKRRWTIERKAKFITVSMILVRSSHPRHESHQLFACGDNTYLNLCKSPSPGHDPCDDFIRHATSLMEHFRSLGKSRITSIACTEYASFALVDKPTDLDDNVRQRHAEFSLKKKKANEASEPNEYNHVFSWGRGDRGVLGHGNNESIAVPRIINTLNYFRVTQIAAGRQHVLALTESNGVFAFGHGSHGQLGLGHTSDSDVPAHIDTFDGINVTFVAAGDDFSAALTDTVGSRQVFMWGSGQHGKLGNGEEVDRLKPTRVNALRGVKATMLSCGGSHTLVVAGIDCRMWVHGLNGNTEPPTKKAKSTVVYSWGHGGYGQLGHRDNWDVMVPKIIDEIAKEHINFVSGGTRHSLAISESGKVWAWGQGTHGHQPDHHKKDWTSSATLFPRRIHLPDMHVIGGVAGRGRTFVWGDRAKFHPTERSLRQEYDSLSSESQCSMASASKQLSSNCLRVLYTCGTCHYETVCVVCATKCHAGHSLLLRWTIVDCLSRHCDCGVSGQCMALSTTQEKGATRNI
ncbi:hypothetical protein AeMF1_018152 [Aphanomyces euteiches]|nr:hypothetical protein AeMF1_018152 [Aphanomyces euteiches]KAH9190057.1 hypothetical protein AeNC1_007968 [Aphanomyces euteiches]